MIKCTAPVKKPHAPRVNHTLKEDRQQRVNRRKTRSPIITSTPLKTKIYISEYANKSVDEFMAEAFSEAKLSSNPSPYSKQVLEIVDKYFKKKPVETVPNKGIIKSDLQFFTKKHKPKKVPDDDPLWDSLVKGDVEKQMEDGIFEWEHGG